MKVEEWCIALDNVSPYINSVLGLRYKFLKGERATKEKVFSVIPEMTEEKYAELFRPATEEEINGEFEWDGEQYVLKKSKRMMSVKEKAEQVFPIEDYGDLDAELQRRKMRLCYEHGANYVVEEIENLVKTTLGDGEGYHYNLYIGLVKLLEQLKK